MKDISPMLAHINVGYGSDVSINEIAQMIADVVGYKGTISYDSSKPDGSPQKLLDSSRIIGLGWRAKFSLKTGIKLTYEDYLNNSTK
jgi:nucleoside-diphosphate-sugar epimerase